MVQPTVTRRETNHSCYVLALLRWHDAQDSSHRRADGDSAEDSDKSYDFGDGSEGDQGRDDDDMDIKE